MSFYPKSGDHAIVEVVFGITLSRAFTHSEVEEIANSHALWRDRLPKMSRLSVMQFSFGENTPSELPAPPVAGIMFDSYKSDGSLDWRLQVGDNGVFVNCLSYTRWADVFPIAYNLLRQVVAVIRAETAITSIALQYVDVFEWRESAEDYNLGGLLNKNSRRIPLATFDEKAFWHLHQGRFNYCSEWNGRVLERVDLDGFEGENSIPAVKMDVLLQHQFKINDAPDIALLQDEANIDNIFDFLHEMQKKNASDFLAVEMCERIGLNVEH